MSSPIPSSSSSSPTTPSTSPSRKRSHSTSNGDSSPPSKKKCKTRHCGNTNSNVGESSAAVSRVACSALSSSSAERSSTCSSSNTSTSMDTSEAQPGCSHWDPTPKDKHRKQRMKHRLMRQSLPPQCHPDRLVWNALFINKLQMEVYNAQQHMDGLDFQVMKLFASSYGSSSLNRDPVLYLKRQARHSNRMDWKKLCQAIAQLNRQPLTSSAPVGKVGLAIAQKTVNLLKKLYIKEHSTLKTRSFANGANFTQLCAMVLASQGMWVQPTSPLTNVIATVSFISGTDIAATEQNPENTFNNQWAVSMIQHKGTTIFEPYEEESDDND